MIETPEAHVIAHQMRQTLAGKQIQTAVRGNAPHKFAFYTRSPEEYAAALEGQTLGEAYPHGAHIIIPAGQDQFLIFGGGGERILYHPTEKTVPKKHHFFLQFTDQTALSVTVQGWGSAMLMTSAEIPQHMHLGPVRPSPLNSAEFTFEYLDQLFDDLPDEDSRSIKFFMISKPGIWGVGNGCTQDILFRAGLHPRRRAVNLTWEERARLHSAVLETLQSMAELGGRDSERDLFNCPGGYKRLLSSETVGKPCPNCGTPIQKISFLGGASYFCPTCQR